MDTRDLPALTSPLHTLLARPMAEGSSDAGISLRQFVSIVWAYRKQALLIAGAVILLGVIGSKLWPRSYEATATLMLSFDVNDPLAGKEFPTGLLGSYVSTQVELARGSEVLLAMVDRLALAKNKNYTEGYSGPAAGLRDWIVSRVQKHLLVEPGRYGSQLIYITYTAANAKEAADVANTIAEVYSEQQYRRLTGPASEQAKRYTVQLSELKDKVNHAQELVTAFRRKNGLIDTTAKTDTDLQILTSLEQRLLEAQNARRTAAARATSDQMVGSQVLNSSMIQSLKTQLATQNAHMAELKVTLGPMHPRLLALQSEISATRQSLNTELHVYSGNAKAELTSATQLEGQLQKATDSQRASVIRIRQLQDEGAKYQLELDSAQVVYKRALDGYDQVMFASGGGYTNVNFVSRATPPAKPSKPKIRVALVLACLFGGGLGLAIPFGYEILLNRRVRCRDDLEREYGIPVLMELSSFGRADSRLPHGSAA